MFICGIDISKFFHVASLIDSDSGQIIFDNFKFNNDFNGFDSFSNKISSCDDIILVMESTGHYADNFISFFFNKGFNIAVINPIATSHIRKASIRDIKNDHFDSINIAKAFIINPVRFIDKDDINSLNLKKITRFRNNAVKQRAKFKIKLVSAVDIIFPELHSIFKSGIHSKACYQILKRYPDKDKIAALNVNSLTKILSKFSRGHFKDTHASLLKSLASDSVGISDFSLSILIPQLIESIVMLDKQIEDIEKSIDILLKNTQSVITSVPGIGFVAAASILGEIGNIERFSSSSKLLAFAGLDPKVRQSGTFYAKSSRMSKRGSRSLRYTLIYAAWNVVRNNQIFKIYYEHKRSQGKSHYQALGHVAHKLVRVLFKLLSDNIPFNEKFLV